jgi:hypothetical protein
VRKAQRHLKQASWHAPLLVSAFLLLVSPAVLHAGPSPKLAPKRVPQPAAQMQKAAARAAAIEQPTFPTPEAALEALVGGVKAKDHDALMNLFGPESQQLLSGDRVEDRNALERFSASVEQSAELQKNDDGNYTVLIGENHWPFPIPIASRGDRWFFDTKAGLEEILNRRIGQNELAAIATCRAYAVAQWEYYTESGADTQGLAVYARKFISSAGHHDGLYWETAEGENPSPLGQLVAEARTEGYGPRRRTARPAAKPAAEPGRPREPRPFHGYRFKILTAQGASAPGGKFSYVINGNMIAGYALVAYPAKWGNSGVMTFIINQQGRVYQKNLGSDTGKIASEMTEYNPDPTWQLVEP